MLYFIYIKFFSSLVGAMLGSFANVLIYRLPREESLLTPGSHCPHCEKKIPFYLNIPVLSFLLLKGKCHFCTKEIPRSYFWIELISLTVAFFWAPSFITAYSLYEFFFKMTVFVSFLSIIIIDLKHHIIPNEINLYLGMIFLMQGIFFKSYSFYLYGFLIGFLLPASVAGFFYWRRKVMGLGGGDIKLYAVLGLILGPYGIMMNIFFSCFLGAIIGLILMYTHKIQRETHLPFGPAIIFVAFFQLFFPDAITFLSSLLFRF